MTHYIIKVSRESCRYPTLPTAGPARAHQNTQHAKTNHTRARHALFLSQETKQHHPPQKILFIMKPYILHGSKQKKKKERRTEKRNHTYTSPGHEQGPCLPAPQNSRSSGRTTRIGTIILLLLEKEHRTVPSQQRNIVSLPTPLDSPVQESLYVTTREIRTRWAPQPRHS